MIIYRSNFILKPKEQKQPTPFMLFYICNMKKGSIIIFSLIILFASCNNNDKPAGSDQTNTTNETVPVAKKKTIVFFGNSLTAGYGLSPEQAFPALIQKKIDSLGLPYHAINAGVSGETSSGGKTRIDWILQQPVDIFILELGANDGLRGTSLSETKNNLQDIIDRVKAKNPDIKLVLAGMQVPPNMGQVYSTEFKNLYPDLAAKNSMTLIPFLLEGVGGETNLNQSDGIHPTAEGHHIVAENVWKELKKLL
jgi:acyl-CoA thioesterase I